VVDAAILAIVRQTVSAFREFFSPSLRVFHSGLKFDQMKKSRKKMKKQRKLGVFSQMFS